MYLYLNFNTFFLHILSQNSQNQLAFPFTNWRGYLDNFCNKLKDGCGLIY